MLDMSSMIDMRKHQMTEEYQGSESRKYLVRILGATLVYAAALVLSIRWLQDNPPTVWKYPIAVLPVLPALVIPIAAAHFFRTIDELQRKIQLEGLAFGFIAAAVVTLTYGFLGNAGLPQPNWVWVWPVMGACWVVGLALARRRYR
jgi:hypothetical protein